MSVDYFLIEGPRVVPAEYSAWQEALSFWHVAADRVFKCEVWDGAQFDRLNDIAVAAKQEADWLELVARSSFAAWDGWQV